ncbi:protein of unknown function [Streptomyces murinus]
MLNSSGFPGQYKNAFAQRAAVHPADPMVRGPSGTSPGHLRDTHLDSGMCSTMLLAFPRWPASATVSPPASSMSPAIPPPWSPRASGPCARTSRAV